MMFRIRTILSRCLLVGLATAVISVHADEPITSDIQRGVSAKPVKRSAPHYPSSELRHGRQGWVQLSYVVTTDGKVVDPVVEDSSGSRSFERAALRTVEDWGYEPAIWNGQPVQQCETKVMITFALEGDDLKVSEKFFRAYRKVDKKLLNEELGEAGKLLDESFESLNMTLAELGWYWALRTRYAGQIGDKENQLVAVRKATASNGRWINKDLYPGLLLIRTIRELENGDIAGAKTSYDKLLKTGSDLPQIEALRPSMEKVEALIASDDALSVPALISGDGSCTDCTHNWNYKLLRSSFSIAGISGSLNNLEIRCSRQRIVDTAREGVSWQIPESWGSCSVIVFGEPGASFTLLEEPAA